MVSTMKVDRDARRDVDEWLLDRANMAVDEELDAEEFYRFMMEELERDYQRDREDLLAKISNQANCEGWTANQWRDALLATYLFDEDELAREYRKRETDDLLGDPYDDPIYFDMYEASMNRTHSTDHL